MRNLQYWLGFEEKVDLDDMRGSFAAEAGMLVSAVASMLTPAVIVVSANVTIFRPLRGTLVLPSWVWTLRWSRDREDATCWEMSVLAGVQSLGVAEEETVGLRNEVSGRAIIVDDLVVQRGVPAGE